MEYTIKQTKPGEDMTEVIKARQMVASSWTGHDTKGFAEAEDDLDEMAINIILEKDGEPVGCGRLLLDMESDRIIIEQIGVIKQEQGSGAAIAVADALMNIAKETETETIWAKPHGNPAAISLLEKKGFEQLNPYWMTYEI